MNNANGSKINLDTKQLDQKLISELDAYIASLEDKQGNLIHVLHKGQDLFGYLPENLQLYIARAIDLPASKVNGVVSFYSFFTQEPRGEHVISVCMGTACFVRGAEKILNKLKADLDVQNGKMTADGKFTLRDIRCVGACGLAPVVLIDDKVYGHVTPDKIGEIINEYREGNRDGN